MEIKTGRSADMPQFYAGVVLSLSTHRLIMVNLRGGRRLWAARGWILADGLWTN
jgi:hypothetical protein